MNRPLLTIAVPTYNRANLLDLCLGRILDQVALCADEVEVLVSNNAAIDHTKEVVARRQQEHPTLRYSENEKNGGPDYNIAKCFELATGTYVWVFSDDDLLLPNALERLLPLLRQQELGIVTLATSFYRHSIHEAALGNDEPLTYTLYDNPAQLAAITHFWLTYITGIITNKDLVQGAPTLYEYQNSFMIQLGWVIPALFQGRISAQVTTPLILGRALETMDFKLFHVFGTSYPMVLAGLARQGALPESAKEALIEAIISRYFPTYIQPDTRYTHGERPLRILGKAFWRRKSFWTILMPLFIRRQAVRSKDALLEPVSGWIKRIVTKMYGRVAGWHRTIRAAALTRRFQEFGPDSYLPDNCHILHPERVTVGRGLRAMPGLLIETHLRRGGYTYEPQVQVGSYVQLGTNCHLDCCTGIRLGDWVMVGHQVTITDNEPDNSSSVMRSLPPANRRLLVRGPVIIEDNVLIEDNARILSGVTIGFGAIIKAGAVISESVLPYTVVAGAATLEAHS